MIWIAGGLVLLFIVLGLLKGLAGSSSERLARGMRILAGVLVIIFALFMMERGRILVAIPALLFGLGLIRGWAWGGFFPGKNKGTAQKPTAKMTVAEAYDILGLAPGAKDDDIKAAHRRLMAKIHPDHGGTDYLATKINQARDVLLKP